MSVKAIFMFVLLAFATGAKAQQSVHANDTTLKGSSIQIIQSYKPQVKQAPKPGWIPQLPPTDTSRPTFTYDVPPQSLYYSYSSLPLRPLSLTGDSSRLLFQNYVKAGGGNFTTLYLDAGITSLSGENYETAIHLHHISQQGNIEYQQSAQSGIEADGLFHTDHSEWHAALEGERNQYNYYGYDAAHLPGDLVEQIYTTARINVDMRNKEDSNTITTYHPAFTGSLYNARFNTSESTFGINFPVYFRIDSNLTIPVGLSGTLTNYKSGPFSTGNNVAELMAGLDVHQRPGVNGHALLGVASGKSGLYVLPDLLAFYSVPGNKFTISAGWQATLRQNTYEQLTTENPFLSPLYIPLQTRKDEVFGDVLINMGNHLSVSGRVSWWDFNNLATFVNNTGDQREFNVDYINAKAVSLRGSFRYKVAEIWSLGFTGDFYSYYGNTPAKVYVWGEPDVKIKGDFMVRPFPKLTVTAYLAILSGIWEQDISNNPVKMDIITDLGGNVEYRVIPRLTAFVQLDNLLNENYQRWRGYQSYGLNIYGGLRLKF